MDNRIKPLTIVGSPHNVNSNTRALVEDFELKDEIEAVVLDKKHPFGAALRGEPQRQAEESGADFDIHV